MPSQLTDVQIFARVLAAIPGSDVVAAIETSGLGWNIGPIKLGEMIDRHCAEAEEPREREQVACQCVWNSIPDPDCKTCKGSGYVGPELEPQIYTNHRGTYPSLDGRKNIDGNDGWPWHAWSGAHIAYVGTEQQAIENLKEKMGVGSEDVEPSELNIAIDYLDMGETEEALEILRKLAAK